MASHRTTPLIPQHEFHQIRGLASVVPLPRSRRGLKHVALLCLGPLCVFLIYLFTGSRSSANTITIPGSAAVEDLVRKGREGYRAVKQKASATKSQRPKGKLRLDKNDDAQQQSWRDTLVDKLFPGQEDTAPSSGESAHLQQHNYMDNGLVAVNPHGRHPIFDLLTRSQAAWSEKTSRQSKTLRQATKEYRKRYQRPPPKGFDLWYVTVTWESVKTRG
jgi:hypothetical protein